MATRLDSVTFTSGDGVTIIPSYLAIPDGGGPHPVVLILRGVAGPDDGYTEIAQRLAGWGYVALVHGWKVRGIDPTDEPVYADLQGAMSFLRSVAEADLERLAVFGFCRGGVHAFMAARAHPEIRVVVAFHGFAFRPAGAQPGVEPYDLAGGVTSRRWSCTGRRTSGRPWRTCVGWRRGCRASARTAPSCSTTARATALPCVPIPAIPRRRRHRASSRPGGSWRNICPFRHERPKRGDRAGIRGTAD